RAAQARDLDRTGARVRDLRGLRQVDLERRALGELAVDPDAAAGLLDDAEHRGEAEAGALAAGPGGGGRLRASALPALFPCEPGVAHREHDVRAGRDAEVLARVALVELDVRGLDGERAAAGHRVARVDREVHDHLLDVAGVRLDAAEARPRPEAHRDVLAEQA